MIEHKKPAKRTVEELISKFESLYDQAEALRQQLDRVTKKLDEGSGTFKAIRDKQPASPQPADS